MNVRSRIGKLEQSGQMNQKPYRIGRFIVNPGLIEPKGYTCEGITIMRDPGESNEALTARCFESVDWPEHNHRMIFKPIGA